MNLGWVGTRVAVTPECIAEVEARIDRKLGPQKRRPKSKGMN